MQPKGSPAWLDSGRVQGPRGCQPQPLSPGPSLASCPAACWAEPKAYLSWRWPASASTCSPPVRPASHCCPPLAVPGNPTQARSQPLVPQSCLHHMPARDLVHTGTAHPRPWSAGHRRPVTGAVWGPTATQQPCSLSACLSVHLQGSSHLASSVSTVPQGPSPRAERAAVSPGQSESRWPFGQLPGKGLEQLRGQSWEGLLAVEG